MTMHRRGVLRLERREEKAQEPEVLLDVVVIDALLPCREFRIGYKTAEFGKVSMTTEFLLRLVRSIDGIDESSAVHFFGFDESEFAYVVCDAESRDYIQRRGGRLWLTTTGLGLFRDGGSVPTIFEVEKRSDYVGFDLISLAPQERASFGMLDRFVPELRTQIRASVGNERAQVPEAFRRHFVDLIARRDASNAVRRELYSVDEVVPLGRFSIPIEIVGKASAKAPSFPEPSLESWRTGRELDDRSAVLHAAAEILEGLQVPKRVDAAESYSLLLEFAPEFLGEFRGRDGFAVNRYYKEAASRRGEFRVDRRTVPAVGPLFSRENSRRIFDALRLALDDGRQLPSGCAWLVPQANWGMTRVLPATLETISKQVRSAGVGSDPMFTSMALITLMSDPKLVEACFDRVLDLFGVGAPPSCLEVLLVPGLVTAALVHAPLLVDRGVPVPLGFVSCDRDTVLRTQEFLARKVALRGGADDVLSLLRDRSVVEEPKR